MKFTKYHIVVIGIYLVLVPLLILFFPEKVIFKLVSEDNPWAIGVFVSTLLIFFLVLIWKGEWRGIKVNPKTVSMSVIYGFLFALPEEILFRGVIQGFLVEHFSVAISILISSFVFGAAHLLNGAKSFGLNGWNWRLSSLVCIAGFPLGTLYWLTGSLLMPTLLHTVFVTTLQLIPYAEAESEQ